ncbi:hypothetical protein J6590_029790 [Homalodisca vitripennis]|nr:hypothetical protein J6590_029790 [Homalodisca vitripennis]
MYPTTGCRQYPNATRCSHVQEQKTKNYVCAEWCYTLVTAGVNHTHFEVGLKSKSQVWKAKSNGKVSKFGSADGRGVKTLDFESELDAGSNSGSDHCTFYQYHRPCTVSTLPFILFDMILAQASGP